MDYIFITKFNTHKSDMKISLLHEYLLIIIKRHLPIYCMPCICYKIIVFYYNNINLK